jgi:hypothetical protein
MLAFGQRLLPLPESGSCASTRALGSFFIGIGKQRVPVKMFGTLDKAVAWSHERIALFDAQLTA